MSGRAGGATLEVAVCQLTSVDDLDRNLDQIFESLATIESGSTDLVCFPENALYLRVREGSAIPALHLTDECFQKLALRARELDAYLHLGSVPLARDGRLFNSSVLIGPDGSIRDAYQKIHLFDVDVAGAKPVRESDVFAAGSETSVLEIRGWKIGSSICYDLRFAELFLRYAQAGVDVILIPSAFLVPTGKAHWEILTRARAIESQAYVLAAAQGGSHVGVSGGTRSTFGHSLVIDPWGEVLAEASEDKRVLRATLSRERLENVRRQIPMSQHRKLR